MKKIFLFITALSFSIVFLNSSCTDDFGETNRKKEVTINANIGGFFAYSMYKSQVEYWYWFYNGRQLMELIQQSVPVSGNTHDYKDQLPGLEYGRYFGDIAPNLYEIRRQIDAMAEEEKDSYQCIYAVTYLAQVFQALQLTEMYGDIPYTEAIQGRYDKLFSPKYDNQKELLNIFVGEINTAIGLLKQFKETEQMEFSDNGDFLYFSDWDKWQKFGNSLKIKIAVSLNSAGEDVSTIVSSALADGIFEGRDDQYQFDGKMYYGNDAMGYFNNVAGKNFVDFLNVSNDPRKRIFLEKNELTQEIINDHSDLLPEFIANAPSLDEQQYVGAFVSSDKAASEDGFEEYWEDIEIGEDSYSILSPVNRRLFDPKYDSGDGVTDGMTVDYWYGYPQLCFYMAELIEEGVTQGDAQEWYTKGIQSSMENYDYMASRAKLENHTPITQAEIDAYLSAPEVAYDGNKMEKIAIQQYLNLFRNPTENYFSTRRLGYPSTTSAILPWEVVTSKDAPVKLVRRGVLGQPNQYNILNWETSMKAQGFTPGENNAAIIESQRIWLDLNSPNWGEGGN